ncbi:MAG: YihY/virulence factor BrkB family protein [Oscillospiraceae bacterium]|nr:YihY/virulence factor BrkB family protein [Oscillospiraceae bacterium]
MDRYPKGGLIGRIHQAVTYVTGLKIPVYAANAGYFIVLSLFPTLVLLLGLLRYTGLQVETLTGFLEGFIPAALMPSAKKLILSTYQNTSGAVISISALTALWSASRGVYGLLTGLNSVYQVPEDRGYFYTRTMSVLYTFLFLLMLLLTLILNVFGSDFLQALAFSDSDLLVLLARIFSMRFLLLLVLQTLLFTAMFMALPNRRNRFADSLPGAVLASLGWLVFSNLYSIYVENFSRYANVFGSVYAVALSMLWLYFCICIVFYGGALNHYLMHRKKT